MATTTALGNPTFPEPIVPRANIRLSGLAAVEDPCKAQEMFGKYIMNYSHSAVDHYQFYDEGIAEIPGYEYYAGISASIKKHGRDTNARFLAELQVWGTPEQVADKLKEYQRMVWARQALQRLARQRCPTQRSPGSR